MCMYLEVNVGEHQFVVTGVDDGGSIGTSKHICGG